MIKEVQTSNYKQFDWNLVIKIIIESHTQEYIKMVYNSELIVRDSGKTHRFNK